MWTKELGRTGVSIPEIGVGTLGNRGDLHALRQALEAGALFLDTAETYGTEPLVGQAVKGLRERVFIATKVAESHFGHKDFRKSVDASLLKLGIDQIDLLQLHHPSPSIPIQETMAAMADAIESGKVRFAGVSNFSVEQLREAQQALGRHPIVSNQVRYNLIDRTIEKGLLQYCQSNGITVIAYSPLARNFHRIGDCDPRGTIQEIARMTGKTSAQVVLNWCVCKEGVVAIPGGNSAEHLLENCGGSGWRLSPHQLARLNSEIQFRQRTGLDAALRKYTPKSVLRIASTAVNYLPRALRRRIT
jgi:diketogulonate reductase-like aldo/keto reductase